MSNKNIVNSWFGRLLGKSPRLTFTSDGVQLSGVKNTNTFTWQQLKSPPVFTMGWFGCTARFEVAGEIYQVPYLAYRTEQKFKPQVIDCWVTANKNRLASLVSKIDELVANRYLRHSYQESIKQAAKGEFVHWFPWATSAELTEELGVLLTRLSAIVQWQEQSLTDIREAYIAEHLDRYHHFFDTVESNPLTDNQRRACVIDDDNNLLLAGAGTGKTSVMVGRAGYLIESQQAVAEDILLLAYGKDAAKEMDQRIKLKLDNDDIKASTFHSLGLRIISEVEGNKPSLCPWVNDAKAKGNWVHHSLENLILDDGYRHKIFEYFSKYYYVEKNDFDFSSLGDYLDYLSANDIRSLKGDLVKSFGELYISNWLFCMGIEYQYEARYEHKVSCLDFRQYEPDFYLPEYGIYIEYYGTDELGNTAPYIDSAEYQASIEWKRELHQQHGTEVVELFYYQHRDGELLPLLEQRLNSFAVECVPLPDQAILATLREFGRVTELAILFSQLIGLYKAACLDEGGVQLAIANSPDPKQTTKAFELLQPVLGLYQQYLDDHSYIDFEDMVGKALGYVEQGKFSSPWRYMMVDEFQDISEPRARLVRALRDSNAKSSLFCVGDDWQAIYRFSGADVHLTTSFEQYFGKTAVTALDLTFRFNNSIGEIATQFVTQNPVQLKKQIGSCSKVTQPAVSVLRSGVNKKLSNEETSPLTQALVAISNKVTKHSTVYLLARFWFQLPDKQEQRQLNTLYPNLEIKCLSIHASKGKEADYVVLMAMTKGKHGFPSVKVTAPLLEALLPTAEDHPFAEERRLFYVALTRARHRVYVLADMTNASEFVTELIDESYDVELDEFETSFVQRLMKEINCVRCGTGSLMERLGKFGSFYSCSNYPLCKHKENGCKSCGSPMTRERAKGFKVCLSDTCDNSTPLCDACGAEMFLRNGSRGQFWGCRNYRGKETPSCGNTRKLAAEYRI